MPRSPHTWLLRNPHTLPMIITLLPDGTVSAEFPGVEDCKVAVRHSDPWRAREMAILKCAKLIVARMEGPDESRRQHAA